jgi:protein phosphatase 2C family protein 2/3
MKNRGFKFLSILRTQNYETDHDEIIYNFQDKFVKEALDFLDIDENRPISSAKGGSVVKGYCVNSFKNIQKDNLDRVSIVLDIKMKSLSNVSPAMNFFGLFSGHGNATVSEVLKNKLLKYILHHELFLIKTHESIIDSHKNLEEELIIENISDRIGSCSIMMMIIDNVCYISNLGDSRAILSMNENVYQLSKDHVPSDEGEKQRILKSRGSVYEYIALT